MPTIHAAPNRVVKDICVENGYEAEREWLSSWQALHFLFHLGDEQFAGTNRPLSSRVNRARVASALFFAVDLDPGDYPRGRLATMARKLTRQFGSSVVVLFKNQTRLTLAVVDTLQNKSDTTRESIPMVTLVKDIDVHAPHPAHLRILKELHVVRLKAQT